MKHSFISAILIMTSLLGALFLTACDKDDDTALQPPVVPALLEVGEGYKVSYLAFAKGFQVYVCTETSPGVYAWVFKEPIATLYADAAFTIEVGTHYAGPTWESETGSTVVATKLEGVTVDATAIPWLKLGTITTSDNGIFNGVTHIQRINTVGGIAPATGANAATLGDIVEIPYTAAYYFYKPL